MEHWTRCIDDGTSVDVVYLDFQKAFDKVPHRRLLTKLEAYGVNGSILHWIKAFLSNRKQRVVVRGALSEWSTVTSGVPQGSVLGPILFIIYVNDLPDCIQSYLGIFADDTKLYRPICSSEDSSILQEDIDATLQWCDTWLSFLNLPKCHYSTIGHSSNTEYYFSSENEANMISMVVEEKDLGVVFDKDLKFTSHVNQIVMKANRVLGIIKRTSEKVQRRAARWVASDYNPMSSVTYLLDQLHWKSLQSRRCIDRLNLLYRVLHHALPSIQLPEYFKPTSYPTRLHHQYRYIIPPTRTLAYQQSYFPRTIKQWNNLPNHIIDTESLEQFNNCIFGLDLL